MFDVMCVCTVFVVPYGVLLNADGFQGCGY